MPKKLDAPLERGQRVFTEVFGEPARGFVAPAWQRGHVRCEQRECPGAGSRPRLFLPRVTRGPNIPLATWTWDCGRWGWLGHVGHGIGWLSQSLRSRSPDPGDSSQRSRARFLAEDPPAHPGAPRRWVRTEHAGGAARGESMLKSLLDGVMERRAGQLMEQVRAWLPTEGPVLDLGSGTGHLSARLERELGLEVVTADVSDIHVVGPPPVLIADGVLPFEEGTLSAALLVLHARVPATTRPAFWRKRLASRADRSSWCSRFIRVASVTRGFACGSSSGQSWRSTCRSSSATSLRMRSSRMNTRRFYTAQELQRDVTGGRAARSVAAGAARCCPAARWWSPAWMSAERDV